MTTRQKLVALLTAAVAAAAFGCSSAPTTSTQAPDQGSPLPPDQVLKDARHIMVAGNPMSFDQISAQLPDTLTPEQAAKVLVNIPQNAVSTQNPASFKVQGLGYGYGYGSYFYRGFYGGFGNYFGGCLYYPYGSYYFPYNFYGGLYHRYYYGGYSPFFYGYGGCYFPYYYGRRFF